jgi:hypothetical protein
MKDTFEKGKPRPHSFSPEEKVWLSSKDINLTFASHKKDKREAVKIKGI